MPRTNCKAHMEFTDLTAVADSKPSSSDNASIGRLQLLKSEDAFPVYAIPDLNSFVLDGSREIMNADAAVPFVSGAVSGDDCTFISNPVLTVGFSGPHTSAGLTLYFIGDYPTKLQITWYDLSGAKLISGTYHPDGLRYFCKKQMENYGGIKVEFIETRLPGQRIQCRHIKYGTVIEWNEENIQSASITEEVDTTSATVPVNTADISIVDEANDFELSNQEGVWKSIQKSQAITIVEELEGREITCGTLYIDTWKSSGNIVSFSLIDRLGVIDRTKFYDGQIYNDVKTGEIVAAIMASAGVKDYTVAEDVAGIRLTGHIPICTHREALQQVVFACGAVADCSRSGGIKIYRPDRHTESTIGIDRKFMGTMLEIDQYVSGISISYNRYTLKNELEEIYNDRLPAGISLIEFSEPYTGVIVSAGTIKEVSTNYVKVEMKEEGACTVSGKKYEGREFTCTEKVPVLDAGEEENILTFGGCTLFTAALAKEAAIRLLDFYQLRQIVTLTYLLDAEKTGDWVSVEDIYGNTVTSGITRQSIDLTGGFIAQASCWGYSKVVTDLAYSTEIYAGERGLI